MTKLKRRLEKRLLAAKQKHMAAIFMAPAACIGLRKTSGRQQLQIRKELVITEVKETKVIK